MPKAICPARTIKEAIILQRLKTQFPFSLIFNRQFIKFCMVGCANYLLDFLIYLLGLWLGISPFIARTGSWVCACIFSYLVNRKWTFKAKDSGFLPMLRFVLVNLASLSLGLLLLYLFKKLGCANELAFLLTLPFTTLTNFLGYKFWTFRQT